MPRNLPIARFNVATVTIGSLFETKLRTIETYKHRNTNCHFAHPNATLKKETKVIFIDWKKTIGIIQEDKLKIVSKKQFLFKKNHLFHRFAQTFYLIVCAKDRKHCLRRFFPVIFNSVVRFLHVKYSK